MGRFPGPIGIPGLRWFDRSRTAGHWPDYARSYVGHQMRWFDEDLDPDAPTIFELVPNSLAALSVVTRGLAPERRIGALTARSALRAAVTHFRGRAERWLDVDREIGDDVVRRMRDERPDFLFAAFTGVDKASHARGHQDAMVHDALAIVDDVVARLRDDAERGGWWEQTHLWLVSDHGHSPVHTHEDLAAIVAATGRRTVAHPWSAGIAPEAAVMVSGNAMAHIYLELDRPERPWWPSLSPRWSELVSSLLERPSVDLLVLPISPEQYEVRSQSRGTAMICARNGSYSYRTITGDPLGIGSHEGLRDADAYDVTATSDYPDAIVQIARLASASRSGEIILSAAREWDFRSRHEPIPHVSSHGALHREHMLVPLLTNKPVACAPRRTVDVMPSALAALGLPVPLGLDGASFL
jgi:arylsulfatase A-like enzyme